MSDRRNFIKNSAIVTTAAAVASSSISAKEQPESNENGGYVYKLPKFAKGTRLSFREIQ